MLNDNYTFELLKGYTDKDGQTHKSFDLEEIGGAEEEAISKNEIKQNGAKVIRTLLSMCCTRIGSLERNEMKKADWQEIIQSLTVADQDFMLLKLREISKGSEIEIKHKCPSCSQDLTTMFETTELEIIKYNDLEKIEFEMPRGFVDKDSKTYNKGYMLRPCGLDREILDPIARKNLGRANTLLLTRCIKEVEGLSYKITDDMVRNLKMKDRQYLFDLLEENTFGLELKVDVMCPHCGDEFKGDLNMVNFL